MLCSCETFNEETKGVVLSYIVSFEEFKEEYEKKDNKSLMGIFTIDDETVNDDEILVDIYGYDDGKVYVGLREDYEKIEDTLEEKSFKCPTLNYSFNKDGEYMIVTINLDDNDIAFPVNLKYGNHYVITFGDTDEIIKKYS